MSEPVDLESHWLLAVPCPNCGVSAKQTCRDLVTGQIHVSRVQAAYQAWSGIHVVGESAPEPVPFVASRPELGAPPDPHLARMAAAAGAGLEAVGIHGGVQEPAPPDDEHPAPWRWNGEGELLDANGATVMFEDNECAFESSPRVRAIIEAAPQLQAAVRALLAYINEAIDDGWRPKSEDIGPGCYKARQLLKSIEDKSRG